MSWSRVSGADPRQHSVQNVPPLPIRSPLTPHRHFSPSPSTKQAKNASFTTSQPVPRSSPSSSRSQRRHAARGIHDHVDGDTLGAVLQWSSKTPTAGPRQGHDAQDQGPVAPQHRHRTVQPTPRRKRGRARRVLQGSGRKMTAGLLSAGSTGREASAPIPEETRGQGG